MQPNAPITTDLVLLGAGHAHVEVLRRFAMRREPGVRLTLIGREPETPYTGMLPGLIRGDYTFGQAHIDLAPLAASAGARLILAEATAIDLAERRLTVIGPPGCAVRPAVDRYRRRARDAGGCGVAGEADRAVPGAAFRAGGGVAAGSAHRRRWRRAGRDRTGAGPGAPLPRAGADRAGMRHGGAAGKRACPCAIRRARRAGGRRRGTGVWRQGRHAGRMAGWRCPTAASWRWRPRCGRPAWWGRRLLAASGLDCDATGCVRVSATLRSLSHDFVFAAGDCAAIEGNPRPKAGVWAVRAGRAAGGQPAPSGARPGVAALAASVGGAGDRGAGRRARAGLAQRRGHCRARCLALEGLDRSALDADVPGADGADGGDQEKPGGRSDALRRLRRQGRGRGAGGRAGRSASPAGCRRADWAGCTRRCGGDAATAGDGGGAERRSLPRVHRRPVRVRQIAAAHALSDLHAMGARPWTALAVAAVPYTLGRKMRTELADMLTGASQVLAADGCALVGGHSAEAAEAALGFAVTGLADPARLLRKSGLRPGDALVLTKPLGTGIVLAGHMRGLARAAWLLAAIESMRMSNAAASRMLQRVWRGRVHRRYWVWIGGALDGDAARFRCRGDAVAGSGAGVAGRSATCGAWR